jgi:very-short-patch-repair endonuclease
MDINNNYRRNNHCIGCNKIISDHAKRCKLCESQLRKKIKDKCIDCGKEVSKRGVTRCNKCVKILRKNKSQFTSGFKDGRTLKKYYCQICNKELVNYKAKYCKNCKSIGELNPAFVDGRSLKKYYCKDCKKEISWNAAIYGSGNCKSCLAKKRIGEFSSNYKDGRSIKDNFCIDCGKLLSDYRVKRCQSCETIRRYRRGLLTSTPNKPEKLLIKLLPKSFKYVGNGSFWINKFNPDFIDLKNKKIIELFGDYWHNLKNNKFRDKLRLKAYKKYGYQVLIIWEHELKNVIKLINKLGDF